jgi:hypothetical protein
MRVVVTANTAELIRKLQAYPAAFAQFMREQVRTETRNGIKDAIALTPPGTRLSDKRRGEGTITSDVLAVFTPVQIKGYRTITKVFGKKLAKPVKVKTKELHVDVEGLYQARLKRKAGAGRHRVSRGRKQAYYADEKKLKRMTKRRQSGVGRLAAGWLAAAKEVEASVPVWIAKRSASQGNVKTDQTRSSYYITAINNVRYANRAGMPRILERVAKLREGKLRRRLPKALEKTLQKVAL